MQLQGSVEDDGIPEPLFLQWQQVSGPAQATFENAHLIDTDVTFPVKGKYILELVANDGSLQSADTIEITVNSIIPLSPLLGYWTLNTLSNGSTPDSSLHKLDAEVFNGSLVLGKYGNAIEIQNGYIAMPQTELLMPTDGLTVALWIKPNEIGNKSLPIFVWERGSWDTYELAIVNQASGAYLLPEITTTSGVNRLRFLTSTFPLDRWTHLALTYSSANDGELRVYRDGNLVGMQSGLGDRLVYRLSGSRRVTFGMEKPGSSGPTFNGGMDEIYIYNYALETSELARLLPESSSLAFAFDFLAQTTLRSKYPRAFCKFV